MNASKKGPSFSPSGVEARLPMPSVSRANGIRVYPSGRRTKSKPPQGPTSKKVTMLCSARRSSVARPTSRHRWIRLPMWTCLSRNNGGQPACGSGLIRTWSLISSHSTTCARVPEPLRIFRSSRSHLGRTRPQRSDISEVASTSSAMSEARGCREAGAAAGKIPRIEERKWWRALSRRVTQGIIGPPRPQRKRRASSINLSCLQRRPRASWHPAAPEIGIEQAVPDGRRDEQQRPFFPDVVVAQGDLGLLSEPFDLSELQPALGRRQLSIMFLDPLHQLVPALTPFVGEHDAFQLAVHEAVTDSAQRYPVQCEDLAGLLIDADALAAFSLSQFPCLLQGRKAGQGRAPGVLIEPVRLVRDPDGVSGIAREDARQNTERQHTLDEGTDKVTRLHKDYGFLQQRPTNFSALMRMLPCWVSQSDLPIR